MIGEIRNGVVRKVVRIGPDMVQKEFAVAAARAVTSGP